MATRGIAEAQPPERDDRIGLLMTLIHTADSSLEGKRALGTLQPAVAPLLVVWVEIRGMVRLALGYKQQYCVQRL